MYKTCGKFVYTTSKTVGKKCVHSSTVCVDALHEAFKRRGKDLFTHLFTPLFPMHLSTVNSGSSAPVNMHIIPAFHTTYNYLYKELKKGNN